MCLDGFVLAEIRLLLVIVSLDAVMELLFFLQNNVMTKTSIQETDVPLLAWSNLDSHVQTSPQFAQEYVAIQ